MKVQLLGYSEGLTSKKNPNWKGVALHVRVLEPQGRYQVQKGQCVANIMINEGQFPLSEMMLGHILDLQSGFGSTFIDKIVDCGTPSK